MATHGSNLMRRREALLVAGGAGAALAFGGLRGAAVSPVAAAAARSCVLQREVTEGPFYLDLDLHRRNITDGRPGTPMALRFQVVDVSNCRAVTDAAVELWHADASGTYSGVSGNEDDFLRGVQRTNADGRARFKTIVPGWYPGRTPHIHLKVFAGGDEVHTGQIFFHKGVLADVYGQGVYASRGKQDTSNREDDIYLEAGKRSIVPLRRAGERIADGYTGALVLGVNPG